MLPPNPIVGGSRDGNNSRGPIVVANTYMVIDLD